MRISHNKYSIQKIDDKVKFVDFKEGTVSDLVHTFVNKFNGSLLSENTAKVTFFYANGNVREIFGPENEIYILSKKVINDKKNYVDKEKMMTIFMEQWKQAAPSYYNYYNPNLNSRKARGIMGLLSEVDEEKFKIQPGEILKTQLASQKISTEKFAETLNKNKSSVYSHIKGERALSRDVAIEYSKKLGIDPVDLMFEKKTVEVWGYVDFIKKSIKNNFTSYKHPGEIVPVEGVAPKVIIGRDYYSPNLRAVKSTTDGSMYDDKTFFYYKDNQRNLETHNKLCAVGGMFKNGLFGFWIGIYELYQGKHNLINPDPFAKDKYILEDFEPNFISPIALVSDVKAVTDNTSAKSIIPEHLYYEEARKERQLYDLEFRYKKAITELELQETQQKKIFEKTEKLKELFEKDKKVLEQQVENAKRSVEKAIEENKLKLFDLREVVEENQKRRA
tara:strand:- start:7888 stop:9228 length:1341 start_codon:yes stop_codon:yes gene_type:complete